jgi:hypothetical protein
MSQGTYKAYLSTVWTPFAAKCALLGGSLVYPCFVNNDNVSRAVVDRSDIGAVNHLVGRREKKVSMMRYTVASLRLVLLSVMLTLSWTAIAQAQVGPSPDQYGDRAESGVAAIGAADVNSNSNTGSGSGSGSGQTGVVGVLSSTGTDPGSGQTGVVGILPSTGGSLLPFVALGVFGLSAAGLLALRRHGRRSITD